jgi:hypothetical protein
MRGEINLAGLRREWLKAVADDSDGLDPDPVFDRLERKFQGGVKDPVPASLVDQQGSPES